MAAAAPPAAAPKKGPKKGPKADKRPAGAAATPATASTAAAAGPALSRDELRAKFQAKLESFKTKREGVDSAKATKRRALRQNKKAKRLVAKSRALDTAATRKAAAAAAAPVVEAGKQIFSKFDFGTGKDGRRAVTPKNPKQALQRIEARTEKLAELKQSDQAKYEAAQKSEAWAKAIQKAQGAIVKDDPRLLKKSIQRMDRAKEKRTAEWKARQKTVKDDQAARQQRRTDNLQARKDQKKDKKLGIKPKSTFKGKRPGFEGGHFKKVQKRK